jgi:methionyl-tRNA formyltransferase
MSSSRPRAVFLGTPSFAVPTLVALTEVADVVAAVCQPDKPVGRGLELTAPPVKREALARGIPVHQPTKLRDGTFAAWLREQGADVAIVVAYGRILPPDVLAAPRLGCLNVHASLLPRHRGAAPINWAIIEGDATTGVTLMQMDAGLDTGPMLAVRETPIGADETAEDLYPRLASLGAALVREEVPRFLAGALAPVAQDGARATHAPMLSKEMARIDWTQPARAVHDRVRGLQPWPGASTTFGARRLIVHRTTREGAPELSAGAPGEVVAVTRERIWVATGAGAVALTEVQLEGKKRVAVREFLAGHPLRAGTFLGG